MSITRVEHNVRLQTYEIDTNGGNVAFSVGIICEAQQQTRLSNTGVTNEKELEEVIAANKNLTDDSKIVRDHFSPMSRFPVGEREHLLFGLHCEIFLSLYKVNQSVSKDSKIELSCIKSEIASNSGKKEKSKWAFCVSFAMDLGKSK